MPLYDDVHCDLDFGGVQKLAPGRKFCAELFDAVKSTLMKEMQRIANALRSMMSIQKRIDLCHTTYGRVRYAFRSSLLKH